MNYDVLSLAHHEGNPRNSEGAFLETPDGRLIFVYSRYTGESWHDNAAADLACRESRDGGRSWSECDRIVFDHRKADAANLMSVSFLTLPSGRVLLFCCRKFAAPDGAMNCVPSMAHSDDGGQSWSDLRPLLAQDGYYVLANDRVLRLRSGKLLVPLATDKNVLQFWSSTDDGGSWHPEGGPLIPDGCAVYQEPGVIELADGALWCWIRTETGFQYGAASRDEGRTWSKPVPMAGFRSPMSPMAVKRNPVNGRLVAVWNDHLDRWDVPPPVYTRPGWGDVPTAGRHPLVLAESSDEGKTWHDARRLEKDPRRGFCYVAMHFTSDALLLGYCCGGLNGSIMLQDLKIVRLPMLSDGRLDFAGV